MIALASDHGGYEMKEALLAHLRDRGLECLDLGCYSTDSVDYPLYADALCGKITDGTCRLGILVCGTGIGMSMAANKHKGIRAACVSDCFSAEMTRQHNDANVLCLGGRTLGIELAKRITDIFVRTDFSGLEKHSRRIDMIKELED